MKLFSFLVYSLIPIISFAVEVCDHNSKKIGSNISSWSILVRGGENCMDTVNFGDNKKANIWVFNSNGNIINTSRIGDNTPKKLDTLKIVPSLIQTGGKKFEQDKNSKDIKYSYFKGLVFHLDSLGKLKQVEGCQLTEKTKQIERCPGHFIIRGSIVTDGNGTSCNVGSINIENIKTDKALYALIKSKKWCAKLIFPDESKLPKITYKDSASNVISIKDILARNEKEKAVKAAAALKAATAKIAAEKKRQPRGGTPQPGNANVVLNKNRTKINPKGYFIPKDLNRDKNKVFNKKYQEMLNKQMTKSPQNNNGNR